MKWKEEHDYVGEVINGKTPHGKGKLSYSDGATYNGQWKEGKKHGFGKFSMKHGFV
jgi:hypothetical protein